MVSIAQASFVFFFFVLSSFFDFLFHAIVPSKRLRGM